jgi:hypothetical protein
MKTLKTVLTHAFIWSGIYWGVLVGFEPVANLFAVVGSLVSVFAIAVAVIAHWVLLDNDNSDRFAILSWLFRISSYAQAFTLIIVGGAWIALGTIWFIAVALLDTLVQRAHKVETETE